jgi:voltage-gated potassium channel
MSGEEEEEPVLAERYLERRIEAKGLRPRVAAGIIAVLWLIAIALFGVLERIFDPDAFDSIWEGMWWATQTVTTVGYGDIVPESVVGRFLAVVMMIGGLSLFAVVTGTITSSFVTRAQEKGRRDERAGADQQLTEIGAELRELRQEVEGLRREIASRDR